MDKNELFKHLGLSAKEGMVYLSCLELGMTPVTPLVKKTGIPRSSLIYTLEQLRKRSFIEIVLKGSRKLYFPHSPRSLVQAYKGEMHRVKHTVEFLEHTLPDLNKLFNSKPFQPAVRVYKGQELRECYDQLLLEAVDEIWNVGETEKIFEVLGLRFWQRWSQQRAERGIKAKAIRSIKKGNDIAEQKISSDQILRTVRFAPEGFECPAHIVICGDSVLTITTAKESFGVLVSSRDYATSMKSWFNELWKVSA
jgi:sugar-specific transcriptional regulator TrmB